MNTEETTGGAESTAAAESTAQSEPKAKKAKASKPKAAAAKKAKVEKMPPDKKAKVAKAAAGKKVAPKAKAKAKAEKKAPAKKAAPKGEGKRGRVSEFAGMKLFKLVPKNPRREGTLGHKSFSLITNGMRYEKYIELGGRAGDLKFDVAHKYVQAKKD